MPYKNNELRKLKALEKRLSREPYIKTCFNCEIVFKTPHKLKRYCCKTCSREVERKQKREWAKGNFSEHKLKKEKLKKELIELNERHHLELSLIQLYGRNKKLKSNYGITLFDYYALMDGQKGLCPVCQKQLGDPITGRSHPVDHCHETGKIRGIVHNICNTTLGIIEPIFNKDFNDLFRLLSYATKHITINHLVEKGEIEIVSK